MSIRRDCRLNAGSQESHELPQDVTQDDHDVGRQHEVARFHRTLSVPEDFDSLGELATKLRSSACPSDLARPGGSCDHLAPALKDPKQNSGAAYSRASPLACGAHMLMHVHIAGTAD